MKTKLLIFAFLLISSCIFSTATFSQVAPGDAGTGIGIPPPTLIINLGSCGVIAIPAISPYYNCIKNALISLNVTITNGVVIFPTILSYNSGLWALYFTRYINYTTYSLACKTPPPPGTCRE